MQVLVYSLKLDKAEPVLLDSSTHPTELNLYIQVCDSSTSIRQNSQSQHTIFGHHYFLG
jgi:hypothetical protein